jgi:ferrochelatase
MAPLPRKGLLLINLGTPEAPTTAAVRRYLREFLSDPRVIDIHPIGRWLLLNLVILPRRPRVSAAGYQKIWTDRGSPLLVHSMELARLVARELDGEMEVELGMRYGQPSLAVALDRLRKKGVRELTAVPLYPQGAAASTGSSLARLYELLKDSWDPLPVKIAGPFFAAPDFLDAFAQVARPVLDTARPEHVLFSFHGLPERQVRRSDPTASHCLSSANCCDQLGPSNRDCYRAQSFFTARNLAQRLGLPPDRFTVSFQSRLGRTPWIKPYTDLFLLELARRGIKRLAVICPSFVADCLETLEEIGIRGRDSFLAAGGEELALVPCLNTHPAWRDAVVKLARRLSV